MVPRAARAYHGAASSACVSWCREQRVRVMVPRADLVADRPLHQRRLLADGSGLDARVPPEAMGGVGVRHEYRVVGPCVHHINGPSQRILRPRAEGVVRAAVSPCAGPLCSDRVELLRSMRLLEAHHGPHSGLRSRVRGRGERARLPSHLPA